MASAKPKPKSIEETARPFGLADPKAALDAAETPEAAVFRGKKRFDLPLPPNISFLNPPQGETALRAPLLNEGSSPIAALAAQGQQDPITGIAQLLLRALPAVQTSLSAVGGVPGRGTAGAPLARTGPLPPEQLDQARVRVMMETLRNVLSGLSLGAKRATIADVRKEFPHGMPIQPPLEVVPLPKSPLAPLGPVEPPQVTPIGAPPRGSTNLLGRTTPETRIAGETLALSPEEIRAAIQGAPRLKRGFAPRSR